MLVIPVIKIYSGLSSEIIRGDGCTMLESFKPSDIAVIFRGENFKSIYVTLADKNKDSRPLNLKSVKEIISRIDIPITVTAYKFQYEEIEQLFMLGCYRVTVNFPRNKEIPLFKKLFDDFHPIKIVVRLNILNGVLYDTDWVKIPFKIEEAYEFLVKLQVQRVLVSCFTNKDTREIDYNSLDKVLLNKKIKNTFVGGINSHQKLIKLKGFESSGLDSVVIGKGLYENRFACQKLWRLNELMLDDLGPTRRI